jgi:flagellar P-ring protein precursor FlgI
MTILALALSVLAAQGATPSGGGARLKQLVSIEGVRENPLIGYGLVVGLAGTGDRRQTVFSAQSLANLLERMGVSVPGSAIRVNNTAAVMVTATLPAFAQPGGRLDATVSAMGDASNLQGGMLLLTSLRGSDGQVYAVAQGAVVTGGFSAGKGGSGTTVNHPTVGRAPEAARSPVRLQVRQSDFTTSSRIVEAINRKFGKEGEGPARAESAGLVQVAIPEEFARRPIEFVAALEALPVEPDRAARVVINPAGRDGGGSGEGVGDDRIDAARRDRDPAKPAPGGCAGRRAGGHVTNAIAGTGAAAIEPAARRGDSPERVRDAARQFEALLVGQLVRTMRGDSGGWLGAGEDAAGGIATEFAEQQFAEALAAGGGLGLASMVVKGLAESGSGTGGRHASGDAGQASPPEVS